MEATGGKEREEESFAIGARVWTGVWESELGKRRSGRVDRRRVAMRDEAVGVERVRKAGWCCGWRAMDGERRGGWREGARKEKEQGEEEEERD